MSTVKQAPNQPYMPPDGRFDWENEETLVDRRNRLPNRIARFFRQTWLPIVLLIGVFVLLMDAEIMAAFLSIASFILRLLFAISYIIFQFIIMFWFLARTRMYTVMPGAEGIGFKDYRGQPEILEQADQIVTLLRGVKAFENSGGESLTGLLLEGPPGTGKTWLAQAISTEAGVPFFYLDTSSLQAMFMGVGPMKVMQLYGKARKAAKRYGAAVIFLDEIDAIGSRGGVAQTNRGSGGNQGGGFFGGGDMGLLSTMLIEMSGFSLEHGWRAKLRTWWYRTIRRRNPPPIPKRVLTIGATNRISALDPALLRPGRFDKKMRVDAPDMSGRRDIFEYYLSKMSHDESMRPEILASETPNYTPADIKYLLNESLRYAFFDGRRYMTYRDFQLAKPEHEMGLRSPIKYITQELRERIAYREAGHAVAIRLFLPHHRISRLTILRQGNTIGHVKHYAATEAFQGIRQKQQWLNHLRAAVAGRAAEIEYSGLENQTLGVGADYAEIRQRLRQMALAGMLGPLGAIAGGYNPMDPSSVAITPEMSQVIEETFQNILAETRKALRKHRDMTEALVTLLLEKEELLADEVEAFFDQYGLHTPKPSYIRDGEEVKLLPDEIFKLPEKGMADG